MIISRTPLRISFFSGGSDMPSFFRKENGAALSVTIDKYIYVMTHNPPHMDFRTIYDDIQHSTSLDLLQHDITRETLRYFNVEDTITTASISDIVAKGSGLGSSSAFTVGLINCMTSNKKMDDRQRYLAKIACDIEIGRCGYPIGKQDQYAAAYGGLNYFRFLKDDSVEVIKTEVKTEVLNDLNNNLLLVFSGKTRSAVAILEKQNEAMLDDTKFTLVANGRNKALKAIDILERGSLDDFGYLLDMAWMDKKRVTKEISNDYFDHIYKTAIENGAYGGKLLGAGGGGFFIFYVKPENREKVSLAVTKDTECKIYDFKFTNEGSKIIGVG